MKKYIIIIVVLFVLFLTQQVMALRLFTVQQGGTATSTGETGKVWSFNNSKFEQIPVTWDFNLLGLTIEGNLLITGNASSTSSDVSDDRCFDGVDCINAWGDIEADDAINETPSGTIDGVNKVFTLSSVPNDDDSVIITVNGQVQRNSIDFTSSGATVTYTLAPETGWTHHAHYNITSSIFQPGLNKTIRTVTVDDTITNNDGTINCDSTAGNVTLTLPASLGVNSQEFVIIKIDNSGNKCTLDGDGTETINGATTLDILSQFDAPHIKAINASETNWNTI